MGNNLVSEEEEIIEEFPNWATNEELCVWLDIKTEGKIYNVSGSGRREIKHYARVHFDKDPVIAKMYCKKIKLHNNPETPFIAVRKITLTRKYSRGDPVILNNRIVGNFNGVSFDITGVCNYT